MELADDQTAGFWLRRITHDTLVHRLDAELAVGRAVAVTPDLAADGVCDLLDLFRVLPRIDDFSALAGLRGHGQTLHFHATDPDLGAAGDSASPAHPGRRRVGAPARPGRRRRPRPGHGPAAGAEPAGALDGSRLEVLGDRRLLAHWLDCAAWNLPIDDKERAA